MELEFVVRERVSGAVLAQMVLTQDLLTSLLGGMAHAPYRGRAAAMTAEAELAGSRSKKLVESAVVPVHDDEGPPVLSFVDEWKQSLAARKRSEYTAYQYGRAVVRVLTAAKVVRREHFTADRVMAALDQLTVEKGWSGATFNKNLNALRQFAGWLQRRKKLLSENPLGDEGRATVESEEQARAATTDEVRRFLLEVWTRSSSSGKANPMAPEFWACCALAGMRGGEPWKLKWKNVRLDDDVPHILWTREIQKNNKPARVAMHPTLVKLLVAHRERMRVWSLDVPTVSRRFVENGSKKIMFAVCPDDPEAIVFPVPSGRAYCKHLRDHLGIADRIEPDGNWCATSFRKWFVTNLGIVGTPERLVKHLTRHQQGVTGIYEQPPLDVQRAWLEKLPLVWPGDLVEKRAESAVISPVVEKPAIKTAANLQVGGRSGTMMDKQPGQAGLVSSGVHVGNVLSAGQLEQLLPLLSQLQAVQSPPPDSDLPNQPTTANSGDWVDKVDLIRPMCLMLRGMAGLLEGAAYVSQISTRARAVAPCAAGHGTDDGAGDADLVRHDQPDPRQLRLFRPGGGDGLDSERVG